MPKATTSAITSAAAVGNTSRACDQCNYRRIKCDRAFPCDRCELSKLGCSYEKAPKLRGGKRIKQLQELNKENAALPSSSHLQQDVPADTQSFHTSATASNSIESTDNSTSELELAQHSRINTFSPPSLSHHQIFPAVDSNSESIVPANGSIGAAISINDALGIGKCSSSSQFPSVPSFSQSPTTNQPFMDAGHPLIINHAEGSASQYSNNSHNNNLNPYSPSTFFNPSTDQAQHSVTIADNILPGVFHPDSFLDSLYENVQPPSQEFVDFSFLQSWPYWLTGTAANSPESVNPQSLNDRKEGGLQSDSGKHHDSFTHPAAHDPSTETDWLSDSHLIPAIATFFERLHPIMPIFTRSWILDRIDKDEHRSQPSFAAMLLALSSLVKIQPVKAVDRINRSQRNDHARRLLDQSVRIRANVLMGQEQSLDEVLASFYSFATLFGMQEHNAATFRLRESVILAQLMKLNFHESYMFLDPKEQERRLRTYWLLCITERAYALQRGDTVTLRGRPVADMAFVVSGLPADNLKDFPQRQLRLFENVDEAFVDCWHGRCARADCTTFTRERARLLHASFGAIYPEQVDASTSTRKISHLQKEMIQNIDTVVTSHWLQSRLWQICLSHGLLSSTSPEILFRPAFVLQCAYQAHQFHVSADAPSREAHGVGLVEKLFDIGTALLQARVLSTIDELLKNNIDQLLSIYVADLDNSSEEGKGFAQRLNRDWRAVSDD